MPRFGPYKFSYNPEIILWFDSESHTYLREFGSELVPQVNVTSVINIIDKSFYLKAWAVKKTVEKILSVMPTFNRGLDDFTCSIPIEEFTAILTESKKAHKEILTDAGDVGTEAHRCLEDSIKFAIHTNNGVVGKLINLPKEPRALSCCDAAFNWMCRHKVQWLSTERKTYSKKYEYAGTTDGLCYASSCENSVCCPVRFADKLSMADWKSSNQLSISYLYQVAAYWQALIEETEKPITDAFILRLGKEDGEFEPWHTTETELAEDFQAFLACLDLTQRHESVEQRMAESKKARTVRKRAAAKEAKAARNAR